jgi:hypothetical protein
MNVNLYQQFLLEREEILKHKWIESEKQGWDIGFDRALVEWVQRHRKQWLESLKVNEQSQAELS